MSPWQPRARIASLKLTPTEIDIRILLTPKRAIQVALIF